MASRKQNGHLKGGDEIAGAATPGLTEKDVRAASNGRGKGNSRSKTGAGKETAPRNQYNCAKCPGYCCSYPVIQVSKYDLERLAKHFGITPAEAEKRFTKTAHGYKRVMRRKKDEFFHEICRFFDTEKRRCTIYPARPAVCRSYPGTPRCGYYDFLSFERRAQNDPEFVALTDNR